MRYYILMGSPRKNGNTMSILKPFVDRLSDLGEEYSITWLYDRKIEPCTACRTCQKDWTKFGCRYKDDLDDIFTDVLLSDVIVLATPIYSWYCTPPLKALLDRFVYGMNKYYGDEKGPAIWAGKKVVIITTCGYEIEKGTNLFESGIKRYCKHSQLKYIGMFAERDLGYKTVFMDGQKEKHAVEFADKVYADVRK